MKTLLLLLAFTIQVAVAHFAPVLYAQTPIGSPIEGLTALEAAGYSVAIDNSGLRVAVSSIEVRTANNGRVRVYDYDAGTGTWGRVGLDIVGATSSERFGQSIALSGDGSRLVVGANFATSASGLARAGRIAVYDLINGTWTAVGGSPSGFSANDELGTAVAISDDGAYIAAGAPRTDLSASSLDIGSVRAFRLVGGNWTQAGATLFGVSAGDRFGTSVTLSANGRRLVGGSPDSNGSGTGNDAGQIRIFDLNTFLVSFQARGVINGINAGDRFGTSVAISDAGTRMAVGAPFGKSAGISRGAVYVYQVASNGVASPLAGSGPGNLTGENDQDQFGTSIALSASGNELVIGAPKANGDAPQTDDIGSARVFAYDGTAWSQVGTDIDGSGFNSFEGRSVAMSADGASIITGAFNDNSTAASNAGRARVFLSGAVLPVELTHFAAVAKTQHVALNWQTATERGASHFDVERSDDGEAWEAIESVAAAGDSAAATDYTYEDETPLNGANYYRLRQVDIDGAEAFSAVEVVYYAAPAASPSDVLVFPNPARDVLTIAGLPAGLPVEASLVDASGRRLDLRFGDSRIELAGVPAGMYLLTLRSANWTATQRVTVE